MSTTEGQRILEGLSQTRAFFKEVALLVQSAEGFLQEAGWEPLEGNRGTALTGHLHRPGRWIPSNIRRFYVMGEDQEELKNTVLFFGVLLENSPEWSGFMEPWITYGAFRFSEATDVRQFNRWGWVVAALHDKIEPDGEFQMREISAGDGDPEAENLVWQAVASVPLTTITSEEEIRDSVIRPLLCRANARK